MKINNFRGDLTEISAKQNPLRMNSKHSHPLQMSQASCVARLCPMLHAKVASEAPCSCAYCGIKSDHDGIVHASSK